MHSLTLCISTGLVEMHFCFVKICEHSLYSTILGRGVVTVVGGCTWTHSEMDLQILFGGIHPSLFAGTTEYFK